MRATTATALLEAMGDDFAEDEMPTRHDNYSGRGMFGKTTVAVTVPDMQTLLIAVAEAAAYLQGETDDGDEDTVTEFIRDVRAFRTDDMGRGIVVY